jgi:hypothetical protein
MGAAAVRPDRESDGAASIGAGPMYYLDSDCGKRRRPGPAERTVMTCQGCLPAARARSPLGLSHRSSEVTQPDPDGHEHQELGQHDRRRKNVQAEAEVGEKGRIHHQVRLD